MCEPSQRSAPWKTWRSSPINSTVCVGRLLCWILLCWIWQLALREWPPWCSKMCRWDFVCPVKTVWPIDDHSHCDSKDAGSSISDQNWIKNREAAASRVTLPMLYWQINQRMNEHQSLLFYSFPVCPFLILSFQVVCFRQSFPSARLCTLSFHSMLALKVSRYLDGSFEWSLSPETDLKPNLL